MWNTSGFGHHTGIAALLRERGYLLEEQERRAVEARPGPEARHAPRGPRVLRLALAGVALLLKAGLGGGRG